MTRTEDRSQKAPRAAALLAAVLAGVALTLAAGPAQPASATAAADPIPTARTFNGVPAVGALFLFGLANPHTCTATAIRSPGRDLVLTAAHCLAGTGQGVSFAPGYHDGQTPYGVWDVTAAYVDPQWTSTQDPQHDYAFLRVAAQQRRGRPVRLGDVVGGYELGSAPEPGPRVEIPAYPLGIDDKPVTCTARAYLFSGYPAFDCHGYVAGTSGAGWLSRAHGHPAVVGLIGGLHQGGCFEYTSYSSRFGRDTARLYRRAVLAGSGDVLPVPGPDGC